MFFPIHPRSTISPLLAVLLAFCCFLSLIFSLLEYKPHLLIMLPPPLPTLILTPTQMPALLLPDTYTQKLLLPHLTSNPQREPLRRAVILRNIYVSRSSLRHLVFYLQRYSAIFLLSPTVKNSLVFISRPLCSLRPVVSTLTGPNASILCPYPPRCVNLAELLQLQSALC